MVGAARIVSECLTLGHDDHEVWGHDDHEAHEGPGPVKRTPFRDLRVLRGQMLVFFVAPRFFVFFVAPNSSRFSW
jgi:hypothetical protein